jgi:mannose-6-phosphate isomerase-like protein (cupin superfamily)
MQNKKNCATFFYFISGSIICDFTSEICGIIRNDVIFDLKNKKMIFLLDKWGEL